MSSKTKGYGSISTTTEIILTNFHSGSFSYYSNGLVSGANNLLQPYLLATATVFYTITSTGDKRYSANFNNGTNIVFVGNFNTENALYSAVDIIAGYPFKQVERVINTNDYSSPYYPDFGFYNGIYVADDSLDAYVYDIVDISKTTTIFNSSSDTVSATKPCYLNLINGYYLDSKLFAETPVITPPNTIKLNIGYYRKNNLESLPGLTSIDWMHYTINLIKDTPIKLPIFNPVLGTLFISDPIIRNLLKSLPPENGYRLFADYFPESVPSIFAEWNNLYTIADAQQPNSGTGQLLYSSVTSTSTEIKSLAATNNLWNNSNVGQNVGFDINHPLFAINNQLAYDWHVKPQIDGSYGNLTMDSPRTIEIHAALDAGNYAINDLDTTKKRENNLGWLIENIARVNGLRFDANGDIDLAKEKELYQPRTISNPSLGVSSTSGKYNGYGMSCFGTIGMIVPHLPTTYGANGKEQKLFDIVHDNQQLALAILRQQDTSMSIQHGSEIRINGLDGKVHSYPNQLAVSLECLQRLEKINYQVDRNLLISTVAGTEIRELFSGIGIPVTQKFIKLKEPGVGNKTLSLPYFGHQKNKPSTAQLLTTVQINLAVINGVLMPKKQSQATITNPFKQFSIRDK